MVDSLATSWQELCCTYDGLKSIRVSGKHANKSKHVKEIRRIATVGQAGCCQQLVVVSNMDVWIVQPGIQWSSSSATGTPAESNDQRMGFVCNQQPRKQESRQHDPLSVQQYNQAYAQTSWNLMKFFVQNCTFVLVLLCRRSVAHTGTYIQVPIHGYLLR